MSERFRPAALVFDLDGTLVDSRRDIATALNRLRTELGLPPLSLEQVVGMVGEGAKVLLRRALDDWAGEPTKEILDRYLSYYEAVCLDTTVLYPGVAEMLAALSDRYRLAVLSNKGERLSVEILEGLDEAWRFSAILGGDSLPTRKPSPAGLNAIADRFDVQVGQLMLIGDSHIDCETARNAGCTFALIEWGFLGRPKEGIDADLIVSTPEELVQKLVL